MNRDQSSRSPTSIAAIVESVAHLLPEQAPLHTFVHHNTLHAFEHLPFDVAVEEAAKLYGNEPYQTEQAFARHLQSGRILPNDIGIVLDDDSHDWSDGNPELIRGFTRRAYREVRLRHVFEIPTTSALDWWLRETDTLSRLHDQVTPARARELEAYANHLHGNLAPRRRLPMLLECLWRTIRSAAPVREPNITRAERRREQLLQCGGEDVDQLVAPLLIRLTAAFLDQGVASWHMPDRELGFLSAVRRLYGRRAAPPDRWQRRLPAELRRQEQEGWNAERTIEAALHALGHDRSAWPEQIRGALLALPGWAGMMRQFELRPDRAPVTPLPARLLDFVAVRLTLDAHAATQSLQNLFGADGSWQRLQDALPEQVAMPDDELAYEAFVMAQLAPVPIEEFAQANVAARWLREARTFDGLTRRRLLHAAYEHRLHVSVLDGIVAHNRAPLPAPPTPVLQAVFCIDERECSTRRHLEEVMPTVETYGYAGFFGVAMAWQGLGEARPRPLCPVNMEPEHYVTERALHPAEEERWRAARRRLGLTTQTLRDGSRSLAGGGVLSAMVGLASVVPMIGRCLFPRWAEHLAQRVGGGKVPEPVTRLVLERNGEQRTENGLYVGYSVAEMTDIVTNLLRTIGLTDFCDVVMIVGHGSSSLNNPHESAHDCGATGGGRGGPNARAFAAMANHSGVRARLQARGIDIPSSTWFVGAYHNTCDDDIEFYDEDLLPPHTEEPLRIARSALLDACALDAHERCRRFESAPHDSDAGAARRHVVARAVDLAQPRPEYGHATNAFAVVGRRDRTRGLFLDRRAFLVSYDPTTDPDGDVLLKLLGAVVPVGAGINLEYYFSYVDPVGYGCGTKLPHNITGLIGVMDGHDSDLRTGLPWQMVEIHEPVRLLAIVEAAPELLAQLLERAPAIAEFVRNRWIHLAALSPDGARVWRYVDGAFAPYEPESQLLPRVGRSAEFYGLQRDHLGCARVAPARGTAEVRP